MSCDLTADDVNYCCWRPDAAAAALTVRMKIEDSVNSVAIYTRERLPAKLIQRHDIDRLYLEQSLHRIAANDKHAFDLILPVYRTFNENGGKVVNTAHRVLLRTAAI